MTTPLAQAETAVGLTITGVEYDDQGDYFTFLFDNGTETCFRFMADIVRPR